MRTIEACQSEMIEALNTCFTVIGLCALQPEMANAIRTKLHEIKTKSKLLTNDTDELIEALSARSMLHLGGCVLDYSTAKDISRTILQNY